MLDLRFSETSQHLSSLRQLFFQSFKGGAKGKMLKNCKNYTMFFCFFPLVLPWKLWKKSRLKERKFCEVSEKPKFSICWKFQLSISNTTVHWWIPSFMYISLYFLFGIPFIKSKKNVYSHIIEKVSFKKNFKKTNFFWTKILEVNLKTKDILLLETVLIEDPLY